MRTIYADNDPNLDLGFRGENKARQVVFDVADWEASYGSGRVELLYRRSGDSRPHIRNYTRQGTKLYWTITSWDTEVSGSGHECELRYYVADTLVKSSTWLVTVRRALAEPDMKEPEDPESGWVSRVLQAAGDAESAATRAEDAAKRAEDAASSIVPGGGGGTSFTTDETLTLKDGVLSVNTADAVEADNTLPVTSAAVSATVGNIEVLLGTI